MSVCADILFATEITELKTTGIARQAAGNMK